MTSIHSLLTTEDLSKKEILSVFKLARDMKKNKFSNVLAKKSLGMIFEKPSTRTRVSFEVAMTQLGGHALNLSASDLQLSRGETIGDTAKVLSRYVDCIMARVYSHQTLIELASHATVPVINGLSDIYHPCQALADIFTLFEHWKTLKNKTVAFIGDGDNNVTNSLVILASQLGIHFSIASPKKYETQKNILNIAQSFSKLSHSNIKIMTDPYEAVKNADAVITDTWVSMGKTDDAARVKAFTPYQINKALMRHAPNAYVLHCLPAHRNQEITDEVMDGPQSLVWDEAENRLHIQKAVLYILINNQ